MLGGSCSPCCGDACRPQNLEASRGPAPFNDRRIVLHDVELSHDLFSLSYPTLTLTSPSNLGVVPAEIRHSFDDDYTLTFGPNIAYFLNPAAVSSAMRYQHYILNVATLVRELPTAGDLAAATETNSLHVAIQAGVLSYGYLDNNFQIVSAMSKRALQVIIYSQRRVTVPANTPSGFAVVSDTGQLPITYRDTEPNNPFPPNFNMVDVFEFTEQICRFARPNVLLPGSQIVEYELRAREWENFRSADYSVSGRVSAVAMADTTGTQPPFNLVFNRPDIGVGNRGTLPWSYSLTRTVTVVGVDRPLVKPSGELSFSVGDITVDADEPFSEEYDLAGNLNVIPGPFSVAPSDSWAPRP